MRAEIISVGTELLLGHTVNSDAAYVARELASLGIDLAHVQVVGDNAARLEAALAGALDRADIVITTGGLGPTADDLTKETTARLAGVPLVEDSGSMARLKAWFGMRPISANQYKQALIPAGARVLPNSVGTAPGCVISIGQKIIILLPGPPAELTQMLENHVRPLLLELTGGVIYSTIVRTFGIGEGDAASRLGDLLAGANPTVAPYASDGEMFVKITAKAKSHEEARAMVAPVVSAVREKIGDFVYGMDVPSLENVVVSELIAKKMSVCTAESCTGGLLAKRITDQPGASAIFQLGLVTYSNSAKENILGVPASLLAEFGAVSAEVAREMALRARELANADFGIGISGVAGPDGGTPQKPVGLVYIALSFSGDAWLRVMRPTGRYPGRQWLRNRAASHGLDLLRRYLYGLPEDLPPISPI